MLNKVVLIGTLENEPELSYLEDDGVAVASFTLIVDRPYYSKASGRREVDAIEVNVWRKQAELCATYLNKNSLAAITGRLQTKASSGEGNQSKQFYVAADDVRFLPRNKPKDGFKQEKAEPDPLFKSNNGEGSIDF